MSKRVIAHIDMDAFFAAVEQRDNPTLVGKPVIVGANPKAGKGRGVVSTCSYEARVFGIHSAMPISTAYRLCPKGIFVRGNHRKYKDVSNEIFKILNDFTPDIQPISIDEAFLDITGSYHLFKTPLATCQKIRERIKNEIQLNASIGIAPNKMVAKIASDYCKPDGLIEIKEEEVKKFLWALPIERLWGVGKQTKKKLNMMGINLIGDIAQSDFEMIQQQFGEHGSHLYALSHGIDNRAVAVDDEVKSVSNEHTFETDIDDLDEVYDTLSYLSEKVARRLRKAELKGRTLSLKVRLEGFKTFTRAHTFSEHTNLFNPIYKESKKLFKTFYEEGMKIRLIGVRMSNFHDPYVAEGLFSEEENKEKRQVDSAVDQIKDKFGERAIRRGMYK